MKFVKIDNDYIDLSKVVAVSFNDNDREIHFFSPGFDEYKLTLYSDSDDSYFVNKRLLISELIKVSIDDCEVLM